MNGVSGMLAQIKEFFDIIVGIVTVVGFPIAIYSIIASNKNTQKSIDIQVVTSLAMQFHQRWDAEWRTLVHKVSDPVTASSVEPQHVYSLLNWIDWMGVLMLRGALRDKNLVLDTIGLSLQDAIGANRETLNVQGAVEWAGIFEVAKRLRMLNDKGQIILTPSAKRRLEGQ
jgi:hypothetical protein